MLKKLCFIAFTILAIVGVLYAGTAREDLSYTGSPTNAYYLWVWSGSSDYKTQLGDIPGAGVAASATVWKNIYFVDTSATDHGNTSEDGSLADVCTNDAGGNSVNVELPGNTTYVVSTDYTVPSGINLIVQKGAMISVDSGKTLTINGTIDAGPYQIFTGSGTVSLIGAMWEHDAWRDGSGYSQWPINSGSDLGSSTYKIDDIHSSGTANLGAIGLGGNVTPSAHKTYSVGSNAASLLKLYSSKVSGEGFEGSVLNRARLEWKSVSSISLHPGRYVIQSASGVYRIVYWNSELILSGMSVTGADWYYIYIDGSDLESGNIDEITDTSDPAEIYHSTSVPVLSHGAWVYNGADYDLCIGAFYVNSSNQIVEFLHDGGDKITWADHYEARALASSVQSDWSTEVTLRLPDIAVVHKAPVSFRIVHPTVGTGNEIPLYWRTEGQTGSTGHYAGSCMGSASANQAVVIANATSYKIDIMCTSLTVSAAVYQDGYYLPGGM